MMSSRALLRVPLIILSTLFAHGTIALSAIVRPLAGGWQLRVRNAAFRRWARQMCHLLGIRLTVEGQAPAGRFILVSNHVSYVDIMVLATQVDGTFVAKADLRSWPILGWIFRTADTIFIDRTQRKDLLRVMGEIHAALDRELGVLIFSEGTSGKGDEILPFKASLLQLPATMNEPVHYATLSYRAPPGQSTQETVCWWGDASFVPHFLSLVELPYVEATLTFGHQPLRATNRKALAKGLREAMQLQFTPMVSSDPDHSTLTP